MKWVNNHIEVDPPKKPKKITATRFATILGLNPWSTPFEMWCEITRTYEKPFEDTIYTVAGKTIEPKQINYMRRSYCMTNLKTPTDIYGADYFKKTYGDFFGDKKIFGGMWDSLLVNPEGYPEAVLEFKTTKRSEDWEQDVPEYYALQASLYAYLLGIDDVIMIGSFLSPSDYENPENYIPSAENTITREFKVSERYPNFPSLIRAAQLWWGEHVVTGISPDYTEKDSDILKALSTKEITPFSNKEELLEEAEKLKAEIDENSKLIAEKEKRYKELTSAFKKDSLADFKEGINTVTIEGSRYTFCITKSESMKLDEEALKADGIYDKYLKPHTTYTIKTKEKK